MRIHEFNLVYREKFDLRFSLVKFDFAGDANDFPCERSDPPVSRNFCPGFNEPSERLIGVISSEVDQYGPEWAGPDGDDEPAHLDVFAYIVDGFGIFDHRQLVRTCCNQTKQQPENREQWTHVRAEYSLEF